MKVQIDDSLTSASDKDHFNIHIDPWDVRDADYTIALILTPLLKKIRESKQGIPNCFFSDEYSKIFNSKLRSKKEIEKKMKLLDKEEEKAKKAWDETLDAMIWSFEQLQMGEALVDSRKARIQHGLDLFAKYYFYLWS